MSASFASQEWVAEFRTRLQEFGRVRTEAMSWVFGPIALVVDGDAEHGLEAAVIRIDLHEGSVRGAELVPAADAARAPFAIGGSLARWKAVFGSSLDLVDAVLDSRVRATGDLPTLSRHRALLTAIAAAGGDVATVWQDDEIAASTPA